MTTDSSLMRLRKANPVPHAVAVDGDELFARITALPADQSTRRERRSRRRPLVLAIAFALTVLLASTAYALSTCPSRRTPGSATG